MEKDPLDTVRHAESECHTWFEANRKEEEPMPPPHPEQIPISERCMVDGSWTHDTLFSGYEWT